MVLGVWLVYKCLFSIVVYNRRNLRQTHIHIGYIYVYIYSYLKIQNFIYTTIYGPFLWTSFHLYSTERTWKKQYNSLLMFYTF